MTTNDDVDVKNVAADAERNFARLTNMLLLPLDDAIIIVRLLFVTVVVVLVACFNKEYADTFHDDDDDVDVGDLRPIIIKAATIAKENNVIDRIISKNEDYYDITVGIFVNYYSEY